MSVCSTHRQHKRHGRNPEGVFQYGTPEGMLSWRKKNAEKKAYHAGKHALKEGIREGHYGNRRPHTCRGGSRRNNIPDGSPIPSYNPAGNAHVR